MPVVIQITDTHLFADPQANFAGVRPQDSLEAVIRTIQANESHIDLLIATGDLVHDETEPTYQRLARMLGELAIPVLYLPGNHDNPALLLKTMRSAPYQNAFEARLRGWRFLLLDTSVPGQVGGRLSAATLANLRESLERGPSLPTLIALHHHPIPVGSRWIDAIGLENGADFMQIVAANSQVKGIVFGHTHQMFDRQVGTVRVMGTPSTCVQFTPDSDSLIYDTLTPAYRRLELWPDGSIDTDVRFLATAPSQ